MKTLRNWFVGAMILILFPFIVPVAVIWALVYKIPQTIGAFMFDWLEKQDDSL